jgi:uncharacterized protein YbjT (DUF2867 family)
MNNQSDHTTLVLGGTGKTGSRVAERLRARGVPVRLGSRSADPPFDWDERATWAPALQGASSVYISFYPDLAVPGAAAAVSALATLAAEQGVQRLVLLSGRGEEEAQHAEHLVQEAGVDWTIVRCSWFSQNWSETYFRDLVLAGEVTLPVGDVPEPFVDVEDIADVAVAALTDDRHTGQVYELTGPRPVTFAEAVDEIAAATGRPIRLVPVPIEDFTAELTRLGEQEEVVSLLAYLFTEVLDGRNAQVTDGVRRALGREPRDFRAYVREAAAAGVWNA